jgi:type IV secretory pathway TrbL component
MSPFVRYGMTIVILLYSVYQITNDNAVAGLIGVVLGTGFFWLSRKW